MVLCGLTLYPAAPAAAQEVLRYSSSAQVREAFGMEGLDAFMAETGLTLDLYVASSASAVQRLVNGFSDIASTAERLGDDLRAQGYVEIPFCVAPLIVITNVNTTVHNISASQLRDIFSGTITRWDELGGPPEKIVVIAPEKNTGAYKNFEQLALQQLDVKYDFIVYRSTDVVKLVHRIPWSLSFVTQGAHTIRAEISIITIDNAGPQNDKYPYFQTFAFVCKGRPAGVAAKLVEFAFSEKGQAIMRKNGMQPLSRRWD